MDYANDSEDYRIALEAKLQPARIRATLSFAGLYQITHEMIKHAVVHEVREFYCIGFDESGMKYDEASYSIKVMAWAPKSKFKASLLWLVDGGAITQTQADRLDAIYDHRHDLSHELVKFIVDPNIDPDIDLLTEAIAILKDIRRFWTTIERDIGSFDEFGEVEIDDVQPLSIMVLEMCIDAYVGGLEV